MLVDAKSPDTILIVDDEQSVRKTFQEWLTEANFGCIIIAVADAEAALVQANQHSIDLAILDWNFGAGNDGLHLLEDLYLFNPDVVAIMVTGYAHQATPLDAMRMGVRDYLDKNQDLDRETFLAAVRKQLERLRPQKSERRLHRGLVAFREAVEKVMPLVQSAAALTDPVPLPDAVHGLFHFLLKSTGAADGVLIVRSADADRAPGESVKVYRADGSAYVGDLIPFAHSIAASALSMQQSCAIAKLDEVAGEGAFELQPFELGKHSLLAISLPVAPGIQVILELFDKRSDIGEFSQQDRELLAAGADLGTELLRHALAERQIQQVLLDAVAAALTASESVAKALSNTEGTPEQLPSAMILDQLRAGFRAPAHTSVESQEILRLAEAMRLLDLRHGPEAVRHCIRLVDSLRELLDRVSDNA